MRSLRAASASASLHTTTITCAIDDARHTRPENVSFLPIIADARFDSSYMGLVLIPIPGDCFRRIGTFSTTDGSLNVPITNHQGERGDAEYACEEELQEISLEDAWISVCHEEIFRNKKRRSSL